MLHNTIKTFTVIALGCILLSLTAMPVNASDQTGSGGFIAVSAGYGHNLALTGDGTVWACGSNIWGVCGQACGATGDNLSRLFGYVPSWSPVEGISGVKAISTGQSVSVALKDDGTVWTWGFVRMLGDNSSVPVSASEGARSAEEAASLAISAAHPAPVQVPGLENVKAISAGGSGYGEYVLVLKDDGTVWGWGDNRDYMLGPDYPQDQINAPVMIKGLSNMTKICATFGNPVAIRDDGTVWTWGYRAIVDTDQVLLPTQVASISDAVDVASTAGCPYGYIDVLKADGTVWSVTGRAQYGLSDQATPPFQIQGLKDITSISTLCTHTLALSKDGTVWALGLNTHGQIGNGRMDGEMSIVQVPPFKVPLSDIVAVSAGFQHSMALARNGSVWAWGRNDQGQLGNGQYGTNSSVPNLTITCDGVASDGNQGTSDTTDGNVADSAIGPGHSPETDVEAASLVPTPGFDFVTMMALSGLAIAGTFVCRKAGKR